MERQAQRGQMSPVGVSLMPVSNTSIAAQHDACSWPNQNVLSLQGGDDIQQSRDKRVQRVKR